MFRVCVVGPNENDWTSCIPWWINPIFWNVEAHNFLKNFIVDCMNWCLKEGNWNLCFHDHQVLILNDQLRKEVDSAGPLSELEHWKKMSLRFNSIINHIKGPECKAVVMVLHISQSMILKVWMLEFLTSANISIIHLFILKCYCHMVS